MGMFDYIRCLMPLPETTLMPDGDTLFQTKDTPDQYMTVYTIDDDGRLTWRPYQIEVVPLEERPNPEMPMRGMWKRVEGDKETIPYHGDIVFYHLSKDNFWWEYRARFTEGVCVRIDILEHEAPYDED